MLQQYLTDFSGPMWRTTQVTRGMFRGSGVECVMLSVTRAQPRTIEHVMPRSARAQPRTIFPSDSIISGIRSIRFVQFARFVKLRQNLDRAKLISHWSTWRRRVNDSGLRATSLSYRLIRAETYSCTLSQIS